MKRRKKPNRKQRDPNFESMFHRTGDGVHFGKKKRKRNIPVNALRLDVTDEETIEELEFFLMEEE